MSSYSREVAITLNGHELMLEVHITCVRGAEPPSGMFGPPEFYDPGGPAEFDLDHVKVTYTDKNDKNHEVTLKPEMFEILCGIEGQLAYELTVEAAQDSGEF